MTKQIIIERPYSVRRIRPFTVYLECGYDRKTSCNRVNDVLDIEHHRHHIVVHGSQRVRSPRVVHAAAFGEDGTREQRTQCA